MPGSTTFFGAHIHYIANNYCLFMVFIIIWKVIVFHMLFIASRSHIQFHSCSPPNLSSFFSPGFPIYVEYCTKGYQIFLVQWYFWQWVSSWFFVDMQQCVVQELLSPPLCFWTLQQYVGFAYVHYFSSYHTGNRFLAIYNDQPVPYSGTDHSLFGVRGNTQIQCNKKKGGVLLLL